MCHVLVSIVLQLVTTKKILQVTFSIWTVWIDHSANNKYNAENLKMMQGYPLLIYFLKAYHTGKHYRPVQYHQVPACTALYWLSNAKKQTVPASTDQVQPSTNYYCFILTQYLQVLTSTALYWPSVTKYKPVLERILTGRSLLINLTSYQGSSLTRLFCSSPFQI